MPATSFKYAYLIANFFFLAVWLLIFLKAKHLRKPMMIMSLITASFGPVSELWYFADYWKPEIALPLPIIGGVEDILFGFSIGGIGAFALATAILWVICSAFVFLLPDLSMTITNWWVHGLNLSALGSFKLDLANFLLGGITLTLAFVEKGVPYRIWYCRKVTRRR